MIGEKLDQKKLTAAFDACLLTTAEMRRWEKVMKSKLSAETIQEKLDDMFEGELRIADYSTLELINS